MSDLNHEITNNEKNLLEVLMDIFNTTGSGLDLTISPYDLLSVNGVSYHTRIGKILFDEGYIKRQLNPSSGSTYIYKWAKSRPSLYMVKYLISEAFKKQQSYQRQHYKKSLKNKKETTVKIQHNTTTSKDNTGVVTVESVVSRLRREITDLEVSINEKRSALKVIEQYSNS